MKSEESFVRFVVIFLHVVAMTLSEGMPLYAGDMKGIFEAKTGNARQSEPDAYEPDDTSEQARVIVIDDPHQSHNFHDASDVADWVTFYGFSDDTYGIEAKDVGEDCNIVIEVYDSDLTEPLEIRNQYGSGKGELLSWNCPEDGVYYVKLRNKLSDPSGEDTGYQLAVNHITAPSDKGIIEGYIKYCVAGSPVVGATVKTSRKGGTISQADGSYRIIKHPSGECAMTVTADCHETFEVSVEVKDTGITEQSVVIKPDINGDGAADLTDVVLSLQLISGTALSETPCKPSSLNESHRIGLEEAICILKSIIYVNILTKRRQIK